MNFLPICIFIYKKNVLFFVYANVCHLNNINDGMFGVRSIKRSISAFYKINFGTFAEFDENEKRKYDVKKRERERKKMWEKRR